MSNEHDPHRGSTSLSGGSNANDSVRNKMSCVVIDLGTRMRLLGRPGLAASLPRDCTVAMAAVGLSRGLLRAFRSFPSFDHH